MSDVTKDNPFFIDNKKKLDDIGSGMCLAKWTQVTLQLQTGHNHSCHHPRTHKINVNEIKRNPSALHNTQYKKLRRREMLTGKRPEECDYCWGVEDNSDRFSDRVFKSSENWSLPHFDEIVNADWRQDFNPRYVEVAFSNACNFKCSYCGPAYSSTWMNEIKQHGGYPTTDGFNSMESHIAENKVPSVVNPKVVNKTVTTNTIENIQMFIMIVKANNKAISTTNINRQLLRTLLMKIASRLIGDSNKPSRPPCSSSLTNARFIVNMPAKAKETHSMPGAT